MSTKLDIPMLSVNTGTMRKVDTRNVESLHGIWSGKLTATLTHSQRLKCSPVFSKCASTLEDGRRLENLSWRIWNREALCCEPQLSDPSNPSTEIATSRTNCNDVPQLSASVESAASDDSDSSEEEQSNSLTSPVAIMMYESQRAEPTLSSSRGKEKHITSLHLEKMVWSILEKQDIEPLSPTIVDAVPSGMPSTDITPRPTSPTSSAPLHSSESSSSTAPLSSPESDRSGRQTVGSDTSAELLPTHSVVRGFSPGHISSSYRSQTHLAPSPVPTKPVSQPKVEEQKKHVFLLGGSSGEDESSFEDHIMAQARQSSLSAGLKRPLVNKKQLSFRDEIEARNLNNRSHQDEDVFESDDESEDEMPDSAIEDSSDEDDEEDWEDDGDGDADATANDKPLFQRVDSKSNLVSRRSLLTSQLHEGDRANAFANMARSTPVLRRAKTQTRMAPSLEASPEEESGLAMGGPQMARAKSIIMTTSSTHPIAFSPKTTRRNMLASEMTESLRKAVLFERQQKKSTTSAVLKRRHTAHDVMNLKKYPGGEEEQGSKEGSRNNSWNHNIFGEGLGDYHQAGW